ncbi:MAG: hypothetical protein QGH33_09445 [Pirellulaceae bacterium]|jgi:hypothetical protein|nr:hypothetical protein [Pirellulaceae bacterium]
MTREKLNWRSFDDQGAINRQWNLPATPTFCIIDHMGTIRHKWMGKPGDKTIDAALEKLIQKVKETTPPR